MDFPHLTATLVLTIQNAFHWIFSKGKFLAFCLRLAFWERKQAAPYPFEGNMAGW